jgi:hypothetical protein
MKRTRGAERGIYTLSKSICEKYKKYRSRNTYLLDSDEQLLDGMIVTVALISSKPLPVVVLLNNTSGWVVWMRAASKAICAGECVK